MRTYDYPKRRFETVQTISDSGSKLVVNPTLFSISATQTDRWRLVIPEAAAGLYINAADDAVNDAEELVAGDDWDSREFMSMDTEFRIWRSGGSDFSQLLVAYVPTRASS